MKAGLAAVAAAVGLAIVVGTPAHADEAVQAAPDEMSVALVHGIPDVIVDVKIGESVVINAFRPGSIADISAFAGRTLDNVTLIDDDTGETVLGPIAAVDVPVVGNWSLVAHLDENGNPLLTPFENDMTVMPDGQARLTFRHTAEAAAVDLLVGDQRPITNAANGDSATIEVPAGTLANAQIAPAGESPAVSISSIDLVAGTNTVIYAIGALTGADLDFVVQVIQIDASAPTTSSASGAVTTTTTAATTTTSAPAVATVPTTAPDTTAAPDATTTTVVDSAAGSSTTAPTPTGVATGAPLDGPSSTLFVLTVAGVVLAGGALAARRRI